MSKRKNTERLRLSRSVRPFPAFRIHPLFLLLGVWYACTGDLFLFLLSTLVAIQHECAHAFAAAKLGYTLNAIVLMPFGAVIDGDLKGLSAKDEIFVALCGPLCNLVTAIFFVALWWFAPTMYAFTDTAFYSSLAIALVNLLPAYPLDGGRILRGVLLRAAAKKEADISLVEKRVDRLCRGITIGFASLFLLLFVLQCVKGQPNFTLLAFGVFLLVGGFGNRDKNAVYERVDLSFTPNLARGVEIRRVAIDGACPVKDALRFLSRGSFLVLEVHDEKGDFLFELPQNELAELFTRAETPYESLNALVSREKGG